MKLLLAHCIDVCMCTIGFTLVKFALVLTSQKCERRSIGCDARDHISVDFAVVFFLFVRFYFYCD